MGYECHIQRGEEGSGERFAIDEWLSAVATVPGVRVATGPTTIPKHADGAMTLERGFADVAVYFPPGPVARLFGAKGEWLTIFRFHNGRASFRGHTNLDSPRDEVRRAAAALASRLGARIFGDDGEEYRW